MKYFIGPMSKNIVDAIIEFGGDDFGFIPSRRQVDYNSGYVNNWTTKEFSKYVNGKVLIERDHGGQWQGYSGESDNTEEWKKSFEADAKYLDIIHIDPFKKYEQRFARGINETISNINMIHKLNPNVLFEVGTEQAIRETSPHELNTLLEKLYHETPFDNIKYVVVQSGVGLDLCNKRNTGRFNPVRLREFINICKHWNVLSKEHNGDYLSNDEYKIRFDMGLDAINIAPQFGQIETQCYLDEMGNDIEEYYQICFDSNRWKKWVTASGVVPNTKKELIMICGHYVFSDKRFLAIKPDIDDKIKTVIKKKLETMII